jgi:hypothetical protein
LIGSLTGGMGFGSWGWDVISTWPENGKTCDTWCQERLPWNPGSK